MLAYRFANMLYLKEHYLAERWILQRTARKTGIEIHPGAKIGKGLFIVHENDVAIITPFRQDGSIHFEELEKQNF